MAEINIAVNLSSLSQPSLFPQLKSTPWALVRALDSKATRQLICTRARVWLKIGASLVAAAPRHPSSCCLQYGFKHGFPLTGFPIWLPCNLCNNRPMDMYAYSASHILLIRRAFNGFSVFLPVALPLWFHDMFQCGFLGPPCMAQTLQ